MYYIMFYIFQNVFEADTYIIYSKIYLVNMFLLGSLTIIFGNPRFRLQGFFCLFVVVIFNQSI